MKLREIDKQRYSKHYKIVFAAIATALIIISIASSTLLIRWFSTPDETHLILNMTGVAFAGLLSAYALYHFRDHAFMEELVYVWKLKNQLNRIYRKQRKIEPLIEDNHVDAMIVMNYMYQGSKQLYELDDNSITLNNLTNKSERLSARIKENGLQLTTEDYHADLLGQF